MLGQGSWGQTSRGLKTVSRRGIPAAVSVLSGFSIFIFTWGRRSGLGGKASGWGSVWSHIQLSATDGCGLRCGCVRASNGPCGTVHAGCVRPLCMLCRESMRVFCVMVCECECVRDGRVCLSVREEVWWRRRISHSVGFCPMQPDGSFRLSSLCWVEGHLQNPTPFWRQVALARDGWLSVPALPSWGTRRALGHSVWVENTGAHRAGIRVAC